MLMFFDMIGYCTGMSPLYAPRNKENAVSSNIGMHLYISSATDRYNIKKYQPLHKSECQQDPYRLILGKVKYVWMHV